MIRKTNETVSIRKRICHNIQAYNKYATDEYLCTLFPISLLRLSHPLDRPSFAFQCQKLGLITMDEFKEVTKINLSENEIKKRFAGFERSNRRG
jgi:hypothetical protein